MVRSSNLQRPLTLNAAIPYFGTFVSVMPRHVGLSPRKATTALDQATFDPSHTDGERMLPRPLSVERAPVKLSAQSVATVAWERSMTAPRRRRTVRSFCGNV